MRSLSALIMVVLLVAGGVADAQAQGREIRGTVADATNARPIAGANVQVVGTTTGTLADQAGRFVLSAPAGPVRLRVSMIGYRTQEVDAPPGEGTVAVSLEQDVLNIEGVVVTGQATTVARRNLANAVATVGAQDVQRAPAQSVDRALQGKIAGANIVQNSGAPGGGVQVSLRGVSSINAAAEPLWVIDGVIASNVAIPSGQNAVTRASPAAGANASNQDVAANRISDLNPDDIESIEVLKGASAAAIYGSKASNGVILVTTKRGRTGAPRVTVRQQLGYYELANTLGTRSFTRDPAVAAFGERAAAYFNGDGSPRQTYDHEQELAGRRDLSSETSLSLSGGTTDTRYYISGLVQNDEGIIANTGFQKQSLRLNLEQRLGQRLDVGLNSNILHTVAGRGLTNNDNSGTSFYMVLSETPNFVPLNAGSDGLFPAHPFSASNPLQTAALMRNDEDVWRLISAANLRAELVQRGSHSLRFLATGGADYFNQKNSLLFPPTLQFEPLDDLPGTVIRATSDNLNLNGNANLVHTFTPAGGTVTATTSAGLQYEDRDLNIARVIGQGLIAGQMQVSAATSVQPFQTRQRVRDFGVYLQEEVLMLDDRLLLTGSVRADRSSNNGDPDEYFLYPKGAVSYRFQNLAPFVDELKLRTAYGETGNQPLYGQKFTTLSATNNIGGNPGIGVSGEVTTVGDPNIRPERQREIEAGFDATLFGSRATWEFTYYNQTITDLLLSRTIAPSLGFTQQIFNGGKLNTRGVEITLAATPLRTDRLTWFTRSTFYRNRSTIEELPVPAFRPLGFGFSSSNLGQFFIEEGRSATQIIGPENGTLVPLGDANPDFKMGFTNELTFGAFSLYSLFDWQQGGSIINLTRLLYDANGVSPDWELPAGVTAPRSIPECYPNCSGRERIGGFGTFQKQYIEDASFVKLREVALTYTLPARLTSRVWGGVDNARLTVSGRNLLTFTDYSGLDPEVSNFGNQQIGRGFDVAPFPPSRSFWMSLGVGF